MGENVIYFFVLKPKNIINRIFPIHSDVELMTGYLFP